MEDELELKKDKLLFLKIRDKCQIIVKKHAFKDYPERGFSEREIIELVRYGTGQIILNSSPEAIKGSFLFKPKDKNGRECKLVILLDVIEFEDEHSTEKKLVIVCSAYRKR